MNRGCDGRYDEQRGERDHDAVGEVVDGEEEGEGSDGDEQEGLQERVRHVKLHVAPEHNLDDGAADAIHRLYMQSLQLNLVLDKLTAA